MSDLRRLLKFYSEVLQESVTAFFNEGMLTHAAALSYYLIFSLPSMLLIILWGASIFYGESAVREALFSELGTLVGADGAQQIMATLEKPAIREPSWWGSVVALGLLVFFATSVFDAMRTALCKISQADAPGSIFLEIWKLLRVRLIALALLVSISFLMAVFLILDAAVTGLAGTLVELLGEMAVYLVAFDAVVLDVCASTALFALYFRFLPDITLAWRDIWLGALLTALLFAVGKSVISRLIGNSDAADLYDAAGSILVLMLWVYYAAAMFLFGATFTFARVRLGEYTSLSGRLES